MPIAVTLSQPGGPEVLQLTEYSVNSPGYGEVRLRQSTIGINFVDIYLRKGLYPLPPNTNILGLEGAGVIEAVGPGIEDFQTGDRVAYAGYPLGGYAEVRNLPASRLVHIPAAISERVAGSSMLRGLTAHMLIHKLYPIHEGDWVLVHAAAGGLGQLLTRWLHKLGGRVIGTVSSQMKYKLAEEAGAEIILMHTSEDWVNEVRAITDNQGVHLAVDGIGGTMLAKTIGAVRPFGLVASLGQAAGPIPALAVEELGPARSIGLARPSVLAYTNNLEFYRRGAKDLFSALQDGLKNPIGAAYPVHEVQQAHSDLEAGRTTGSVILTV